MNTMPSEVPAGWDAWCEIRIIYFAMPFYTQHNRFIKTGSGQTYGQHSKRHDAFFFSRRLGNGGGNYVAPSFQIKNLDFMVPPMPSDPELHCGLSGAKNVSFRCAKNASDRCAKKRSDCQDRLGTSFNGALLLLQTQKSRVFLVCFFFCCFAIGVAGGCWQGPDCSDPTAVGCYTTAVPAPGNIYCAMPLRFKLGGRPILSARLNVETARPERKRPEMWISACLATVVCDFLADPDSSRSFSRF
jgi:hypothetical protein